MSNFVKTSWQIENFSKQELPFYRSVCMTAIGYGAPISVVSTNVQLLGEDFAYAKSDQYLKN